MTDTITETFAAHKPGFDRDGYAVVPQFLTGEEFAELRENLDRYIRDVVPTLPGLRRLLPGPQPPRDPEADAAHGGERFVLRRVRAGIRAGCRLAEDLLGRTGLRQGAGVVQQAARHPASDASRTRTTTTST